MHIGWPQGIYLSLLLMDQGIYISKFGQRRTDTYGWINILVPWGVLYILYWGGFFHG